MANTIAELMAEIDTKDTRIEELVIAAEQILHLHLCEQEGLSSGRPTRIQWLEAVDKLSEALTSYKQTQTR